MRRKRADGNQEPIVKALRKIGCSVVVLSQVGGGCPDLLASRAGRTLLLEVKWPNRGRLSDEQRKFHDAWQGEIVLVRTVDDAVNAFQPGAFARLSAGSLA